MDANAIAEAIKVEVERQQANVDYDAMSVADLEAVIASLEGRLTLCKAAASKRGAGDAPAKKEAPKKVAAKSEGTWPELPWGVAGKQDAKAISDYITKSMQRSRLLASH